MSAPHPAGPPKGIGPIARREMRLAYGMLAPTFLIVLTIVLGPLFANFWIAFKPVQLGDLRPAAVFANERLRGDADATGNTVTIQYRLRNSTRDSAITAVTLDDTIPDGLEILTLDARCSLSGRALSCVLGDYEGGFRETLELEARVLEAYLANPENPRDSDPRMGGNSDNILTNFQFTLENFDRIFSASEFWHVLRVSLYYTVFGTAGALVLGLFAAQLLNSAFRGRAILRGLFLFPYVAPVIAVAFAWVILLDPFSGTLNAIMQQIGMTEGPVNFFGQRSVPVSFLGLTFDFPVALTTVIVFEAWRYFPLSFLFILARMQSISTDMYEAAEMDGATPLQQFWFLSLPQLMGILAVLFLLRFIWTFNKFDDIF
ncbi:MAG: sugar ABC transporter permease, partial [Pseudomonadota bacterium]